MSYIFIAIEFENTDKVTDDLVKLGGVNVNDLIVVKANKEKKKFQQFNLIADLYIWTTKYWYGTYFEKLVFVRIKKSDNIPVLFLLKYTDEIRLVIKTESASILKKEDKILLNITHQKSIHKFNEARIREISPGMKLLQEKWKLLVSNGNPYPEKLN